MPFRVEQDFPLSFLCTKYSIQAGVDRSTLHDGVLCLRCVWNKYHCSDVTKELHCQSYCSCKKRTHLAERPYVFPLPLR